MTFPHVRDARSMPKQKKSRICVTCEPDWIRTNDLLLRRQLLYPAELPVLTLKAQGVVLKANCLIGAQINAKKPCNHSTIHYTYLAAMLQVSGIHKKLSAVFSLQDVSFHQEKGRRISITGETGSGKSTLLKIVAGWIQADSGTVLFNDKRVLGPDEQLIPGHPGIAYLPQDHALRNNYRMEELLEYANRLPEADAIALYKLCRIEHLLSRKNDQLSGGEKQRIALARLLVGAPRLLLMDEPFSNLDFIHKNILRSVIADIGAKLEISCILTSHDPADTLSWADEIIVMRHGRIVQQAAPATIYRQPVDEYVAELFGHYELLEPALAALFNQPIPENKKLFVRPDELRINEKALGIPAKVEYSSFHGVYQLVHLDIRGKKLRAVTPGDTWEAGDTVYLSLATIAKPWLL
jgi:ABC-type sugar transport system ATPase subunit